MPTAASSAVNHAVKLLEAEEPMLVSAGLSRLGLLLHIGAVRQRALDCDVLPHLVRVIENSISINRHGKCNVIFLF